MCAIRLGEEDAMLARLSEHDVKLVPQLMVSPGVKENSTFKTILLPQPDQIHLDVIFFLGGVGHPTNTN